MKLTEDDLRCLASWAADCAVRALPRFTAVASADARPREAIAAARSFARGGKRTAALRAAALAALAAAREVDGAATAAARAAGYAAAVAFAHPIATVIHAKHALAPATYAALAKELAADDAAASEREIRWAIAHASASVRTILRRWPARTAGRGRVDVLLHQLDAGLRRRASPRRRGAP